MRKCDLNLCIHMTSKRKQKRTYILCSPGKPLQSLKCHKFYTLYDKINRFCKIGNGKMRLEF